MRQSVPLLVLLGAAVAAACADRDPERVGTANGVVDAAVGGTGGTGAAGANGGAGGSAPVCPSKASTCPTGCKEIVGGKIDPEGCFEPAEIIGCWSYFGVGGAAYGCVEDPVSGDRYELGSTGDSEYLIGTGDWVDCPRDWYLQTLECQQPVEPTDAGTFEPCANLDEATCAQTPHCMGLYGHNIQTNFTGYAGCTTYEYNDGDALVGVSCHPTESCAIDPSKPDQCWFFTVSDCVPDGWTNIFECTAPQCANFKDAGS